MSRSLLDQEKLATLDTISKGKQADDALLTAERKAAGLAIELEESRQREKALAARRLASDKALQAMRRTIGQGLAALLNVGDSTSPVWSTPRPRPRCHPSPLPALTTPPPSPWAALGHPGQ